MLVLRDFHYNWFEKERESQLFHLKDLFYYNRRKTLLPLCLPEYSVIHARIARLYIYSQTDIIRSQRRNTLDFRCVLAVENGVQF